MTSHKYASLGSVSHGTMNPDDLIPTFLDALEELRPDRAAMLSRNEEWETDSETANWLLEELFDDLNACAPPFAYFGAHEGDGSDYGFWLSWDSIDDAVAAGEVVKVNSDDEWPELPEGAEYVLEVTDHGNATLYAWDHTELWSVV